jgi:hypothetical protein
LHLTKAFDTSIKCKFESLPRVAKYARKFFYDIYLLIGFELPDGMLLLSNMEKNC